MGPDSPAALLATLTVLCVEDEPLALEQLATFLGRRCGTVVQAGHGLEALTLFRDRRPDLVVTDILMPGLDGLELAAALRAEDPDLPVIAVTAFDRSDYLIRAIELGIDRYVLKPVSLDALDRALQACARSLLAGRERALRQRLERELAAARHEEALGLLAGGVIHDFNNILQAVMSSVSLARMVSAKGGNADEFFAMAESGFRQARELSQRIGLLQGAREGGFEKGPVAGLLREAVTEALAGSACAAHFQLDRDLPAVRHHAAHLGRTFASLAHNAVDAMPGGGLLTVTAEAGVPGAEGMRPGPWLRIGFLDQGPGVPAELRGQVFEPYASSKDDPAARGQGLSLAVARAVLRMHKGVLRLEPRAPGEGAQFHLYLPQA